MKKRYLIIFFIGSIVLLSKPVIGGRIPLIVGSPHSIALENYPVANGIPFKRGEIYSIENIRVEDESGNEIPSQLHELTCEGWGDKSVKCPLVQFLANVTSNSTRTYYLVYGKDITRTKTPDSPVIVYSLIDKIKVSTGPLEFNISKQRFGFLENIKIDLAGGTNPNTSIINTPGELELVSPEGVIYKSSNDTTNYTVEVEESGPIRAVIRCQGSFISDANQVHVCDFIVRIYAYAGKSFVKVSYTVVDNTDRFDNPTPGIRLKAWNIKLKLTNAGSMNYAFGGDNNVHTGSGNAYLYQGSSNLYSGVGSGGNAKGWYDLSDSVKGITIGIRYFWPQFPKELEIVNNEMITFLQSPRAEKPFYANYVGIAKTHEMLFYFHPGNYQSAKSSSLYDIFQYNPLVLTTAEQYCQSEVFGERKPFKYASYPDVTNVDTKGGMRGFGFSNPHNSGGQHKFENLPHLIFNSYFLLTGERCYYDSGEAAIRHHMDIDIHHCNFSRWWQKNLPFRKAFGKGLHASTDDVEDHDDSSGLAGYPGLEHRACGGLSDYYLLSGDRRCLEVLKEEADAYCDIIDASFTGISSCGVDAYHGDPCGDRGGAKTLLFLTKAYEATGIEKYYEYAKKQINATAHFSEVGGIFVTGDKSSETINYGKSHRILSKMGTEIKCSHFFKEFSNHGRFTGLYWMAVLRFYEMNKNYQKYDDKVLEKMMKGDIQFQFNFNWHPEEKFFLHSHSGTGQHFNWVKAMQEGNTYFDKDSPDLGIRWARENDGYWFPMVILIRKILGNQEWLENILQDKVEQHTLRGFEYERAHTLLREWQKLDIKNVNIEVEERTANITWQSNNTVVSIIYGPDRKYGQVMLKDNVVQSVSGNSASLKNLAPNTNYYFQLKLADGRISWLYSFKTKSTESPYVVRTWPHNGVQQISRRVCIEVKFSQPMDKSTINSNSFVVREKNGDAFEGLVWYFKETEEARFFIHPQPPMGTPRLFKAGITYKVTLTGEIKDIYGRNLIPYSFEFTTVFPEDEGSSKLGGILWVSPSPGETEVLPAILDGTPRITIFTDNVDKRFVSLSGGIELKSKEGVIIPGVMKKGRGFALFLNNPLEKEKEYIATIKQGGNIKQDITWNFTTGKSTKIKTIEIIPESQQVMSVGGSLTLYCLETGTPSYIFATWRVTDIVGSLSTTEATTTTFYATKPGKGAIIATDGINTVTIPIIVGHRIDAINTWRDTLTPLWGTVTIAYGSSSPEIYLLPMEVIASVGILKTLNDNMGIGIMLNGYATSGSRFIGYLTNPARIEIHYDDILVKDVSETSLKLHLSLDGNKWEAIDSRVDTSANIIYGTITYLAAYLGLSGEKQELNITIDPCKDLRNVFVYPNPCNVYKGQRYVTFKNLTPQATIKIFNIAGELVKKILHTNGTNEEKWTELDKLSSGIYIYVIINDNDQNDVKVGKLAIIK